DLQSSSTRHTALRKLSRPCRHSYVSMGSHLRFVRTIGRQLAAPPLGRCDTDAELRCDALDGAEEGDQVLNEDGATGVDAAPARRRPHYRLQLTKLGQPLQYPGGVLVDRVG